MISSFQELLHAERISKIAIMKTLVILGTLCASLLMANAGSPRQASLIQKTFEYEKSAFQRKLLSANSEEERRVLSAQAPEVNTAAAKLWNELKTSLKEPWILPYCEWLLQNAPAFVHQSPSAELIRKAPIYRIAKAVELKHFAHASVGPTCISLGMVGGAQIRSSLEKVYKENPNDVVKGQAALGLSFALKTLGGNPEVLKERIQFLRESIIKSVDVPIGESTVGEIAGEEVYIISNLSQGRVTPEIVSSDESLQPYQSKQDEGKTQVLFFWSHDMPDRDRVLDVMRKVGDRLKGTSAVLIGVSKDSSNQVRATKVSGGAPWRTLLDENGKIHKDYRVGSVPLVYILNGKRELQYVGVPGGVLLMTLDGMLGE